MTFDFDGWAKLYEENPEEFERKRAKVLEEFINNSPIEHRNSLRLTQWECNAIREGRDPIDATVDICGIMHKSLHKLADKLDELAKETSKIISK